MLRTLQGFSDFIMRGNVIDLAVGIVIGAAFGTVVTAITEKLLTPLIRAVGGGGEFAGTWTVNGQQVDWAAFVNSMIAFLITAAVLYFIVVLPMNRLAERRKRGEIPPPDKPSEEILLLTQIRDALRANGEANGEANGAEVGATPRPRAGSDTTGTTAAGAPPA